MIHMGYVATASSLPIYRRTILLSLRRSATNPIYTNNYNLFVESLPSILYTDRTIYGFVRYRRVCFPYTFSSGPRSASTSFYLRSEPEMIRTIVEHLAVIDIAVAMKVDRTLYVTGQEVLKARYHGMVESFGLHVEELASFMDRLDVVIGGPIVLEFVLGQNITSRMTIFVRRYQAQQAVEELGMLLRMVPRRNRSPQSATIHVPHMLQSIDFVRLNDESEGGLVKEVSQVHLVVVGGDDNSYPIVPSYSTAMMGFITGGSLHIVYPGLLDRRRALWSRAIPSATLEQIHEFGPTSPTGPFDVHYDLLARFGIQVQSWNDWSDGGCKSECPQVQETIGTMKGTMNVNLVGGGWKFMEAGMVRWAVHRYRRLMIGQCGNPECDDNEVQVTSNVLLTQQ